MDEIIPFIKFHTVTGITYTVYPLMIVAVSQNDDTNRTWITLDNGKKYEVVESDVEIIEQVFPYWQSMALHDLEHLEAYEDDINNSLDDPTITRQSPTTEMPDYMRKAFKKKFPL